MSQPIKPYSIVSLKDKVCIRVRHTEQIEAFLSYTNVLIGSASIRPDQSYVVDVTYYGGQSLDIPCRVWVPKDNICGIQAVEKDAE